MSLIHCQRALMLLIEIADWPFCHTWCCLLVRFPRLGDFYWRTYERSLS